MKILALEFSSDHRSVAISDNGNCRGSASETGGRNTHAFALIEKVLAEAGMEREEIQCIAIGTGPGSYTGIRTAISLAQGWQLGLKVKLLGISTMDCLAEAAVNKGRTGRAHFVIDAQREEVHVAGYEIKPEGFANVDALKIVPAAELNSLKKEGVFLAGPEIERWLPDGKVIFPEARILANIAARRTDFVEGEKLEPIYLRETTFVKAPPPRILP